MNTKEYHYKTNQEVHNNILGAEKNEQQVPNIHIQNRTPNNNIVITKQDQRETEKSVLKLDSPNVVVEMEAKEVANAFNVFTLKRLLLFASVFVLFAIGGCVQQYWDNHINGIAMQAWWSGLPEEWKDIFRETVNFEGEPTVQELIDIKHLQNLDCSSRTITSLEPLIKLYKLSELSIANTSITSLKPLFYLHSLNVLDCSNTKIADLSPLDHLPVLQEVYCIQTAIKPAEQQRFAQINPDVKMFISQIAKN